MLKDIQNKSNMKRTISDDCISGLLTNAKTGEKFNINTKEEVVPLLFSCHVILLNLMTFYDANSFLLDGIYMVHLYLKLRTYLAVTA